jgi:hypothetical protein
LECERLLQTKKLGKCNRKGMFGDETGSKGECYIKLQAEANFSYLISL